MIKSTNDLSLTLSLNILKALGGDTSVQYDSVDDVWNAINEIYSRAGDGIDIEAIILDIKENGQYNFDPTDEIDAYAPVHLNVNVPQKYTDEQVESLTNTARQEGYQEGFVDGESEGEINQKAKLIDIKIVDNGVYETENGYKTVTVEVSGVIPDDELQQMIQDAMDEGYQDGYSEGVDDGYEDGANEQKEKLESVTFTDNGTYTREDGWNEVIVKVAGSGGDSGLPKIYNGFRFTTGYPLQIDFSQYDWSNVYDLSYMFAGCRTDNSDTWTNFQNNFNGRILSLNHTFAKDGSYCVSKLPSFTTETTNCLDMSFAFHNNNQLGNISIRHWDTSNVTDMSYMFYSCSKLTSVALGDTSNVRNMNNMFYGCSSLISVPNMDTSNVVDMGNMFQSCTKLTSAPEMNTSKVAYMNHMFNYCENLTSVPNMDTSNVNSMQYMFNNCKKLTSVPQFDYSNVDNVQNMFYYTALTELGDINCRRLYQFNGWLNYVTTLTKIGVIDCDSITNAQYALGDRINNVLTDIGGFRNLGMQANVSSTNGANFLQIAPNLSRQSLLNVFNLLFNRASMNYSVLTLTLHANHLALLSDEDIAIATNKGWTIA